MVLTVSFVLAPETGFVASVISAMREHYRRISASGYQAHTTSPSASMRVVFAQHCVHRIPPNVRDDGQRPSSRAERAKR
jgi:hypothetical protein